MVDPATVITAAETGVTALELADKGWTFWQRRWRGQPEITSRHHNTVVYPEWVEMGGVFRKAEGIFGLRSRQREVFWLLTRAGNKYWPQCALDIRVNWTWESRINVNSNPGPRQMTVLLVWASEFMDQIFRDYKRRGDETRFWDGIEMTPPKCEMRIVQGLQLQIIPKPPPAK